VPGAAATATQRVPGVFAGIARPAAGTGNGFAVTPEKTGGLPSAKHPQNKNDAKKKTQVSEKKL